MSSEVAQSDSDEEAGNPEQPKPLTVEKVQGLLVAPGNPIPLLLELHGAIETVRRTVDESIDDDFQPTNQTFTVAVSAINEATRPVAQALAWITAWGPSEPRVPLLRSAVQRLANIANSRSQYSSWQELRRLPAALCLATVGTVAVDFRREAIIGEVLGQVVVRTPALPAEPAVIGLAPTAAMETGLARQFLGTNNITATDTFVSERLEEWLAPDLIDSKEQVQDSFDRYQFLAGMAYFDERTRLSRRGWAPVGVHGWRRRSGWTVPDNVNLELEHDGKEWPLLASGLFASDLERAKAALEGYQGLLKDFR